MGKMKCKYIYPNYSDLTRPHLKWWFSKGNLLISGKSRLVKYYNLARYILYHQVGRETSNMCYFNPDDLINDLI